MQKLVMNLLAAVMLLLPTTVVGQTPAPPAPQPAPLPAPRPPAPAPAPPAPCPCACGNCKDCTLEAPETIDVWVGRQSALTIKCEKAVTFIPVGADDDITVVPSFQTNVFTVTAYAEGTYTLIVVVACKGEVKYAKIDVVAKVKAPKPRPDIKPVPPGPGPAPAPADPLAKEIANAYSLDTTPDKADQVQSLAALYKSSADKVKDAETGAKLLADLKAVAAAMKIPDSALPLVRSRIAVELKKVLVAGTLTPAQKDATKALFLKLADGLAACK